VCLSYSPGIFICFLIIKKESLDFECRSSRLRACLCACSLQSGSSIIFLLFERDNFGFEGLSFKKRKFNLSESIE